MAISLSQPYELICPACQQPFAHETWVIVDAEERPDLALAVREVTLHDTRCPRCGQGGAVNAPLLYHDRLARAVLFGVPHEMPESEWQELAKGLLWVLIGALPREEQLPYLGEVQAEDGLAGVAATAAALTPRPQSAVEALGDAIGGDEDSDELPPLAEAIMALLDAGSPAELEQVFAIYPFLLDEAMDDGLSGLAEAATDQGELEVGLAFERARVTLAQLRATMRQRGATAQAAARPEGGAEPPVVAAPPQEWQAARRELLMLDDAADLGGLLARQPLLGDPLADRWLAADEQLLRDLGNLAEAQLLAEARAMLRGERE
jgi:hypothetical protein